MQTPRMSSLPSCGVLLSLKSFSVSRPLQFHFLWDLYLWWQPPRYWWQIGWVLPWTLVNILSFLSPSLGLETHCNCGVQVPLGDMFGVQGCFGQMVCFRWMWIYEFAYVTRLKLNVLELSLSTSHTFNWHENQLLQLF